MSDEHPLKTYQPNLSKAIDRTLDNLPVAQSQDESQYFIANAPPPYLQDIAVTITQFVQYHLLHNPDKKIAVVTSGGTTVPLENNTVRFIDNFSAGTRGSVSTEEFLDRGYVVIFLYRELSFMPYLRHFSTDPHHENFLDYVWRNPTSLQHTLEIKPEYSSKLSNILDKYNYHKHNKHLLLVPFTTVNQYLYSLKLICETLHSIYQSKTRQVVLYLAAAVSDFFIPESKLPHHKIQSGDTGASTNSSNSSHASQPQISSGQNGELTINLSPVPKFLSRIVDSWCPGAYVISFKLETDKALLLKKCVASLLRYNQGLVIGNLLQTRKYEVVFVEGAQHQHQWFRVASNENKTIEETFIPEVLKLHEKWVSSA